MMRCSLSRALIATSMQLLLLTAPVAAHAFFVPTSGPDGRSATDVAAAPNGNLYATSNDFGVYVLAPGEEHWSRLPDPPGPFQQITVAPDGYLWVHGWDPTYVSGDGGFSWQTSVLNPHIVQLAFDSSGRALGATTHGLSRSADHGASWEALDLPLQAVTALRLEGTTMWAAIGTTIYRSPDEGETWAPTATIPLQASALAAHPDGGLYVGLWNLADCSRPAGGMYRVTAAGVVTSLGLAGFVIHDILVRADDSVLLGAGSACQFYTSCGGCNIPGFPDCGVSGIYRSNDAGATWSRLTTSEGVPAELVTRNDGSLVTVAGGTSCDLCWTIGPGVLESSAEGAVWTRKNTGLGTSGVRWVETPQGSNTIYAANSQSVYSSVDRGVTWNLARDVAPISCAQVYGALDFTAATIGGFALVDYPARIYWLMAGTSVFDFEPPIPDGSFRDMAVTTNALVVAADRIYVAPSPFVGGFLPFPVGPSGIERLAAAPGVPVAAATISSTYLSTDAGLTWTNIAPVGCGFGRGPLAFSRDGSTLYVVSQDWNVASLWRLRAGTNWQPEPVPFVTQPKWITDILVDDAGAVYALARFDFVSEKLVRLVSGASDWTEIAIPEFTSDISLADDGYLYAATGSGVWRSAGPVGGVTDVGPTEDRIEALMAAPNPFSDQAHIQFRLSRPGPVHLAVYDVRGRLMSTLLSQGEVTAGTHDVVWRPESAVANGVFVYRLRTPTAERSGRMLLMRR